MSSVKPASNTYGTSLVQARSRQSTAAKLTVTTAEGDTVTLSFNQNTQARFEAGQAYGPNGQASAARGTYRQQTQVEVSIKGNLSDAELEDIKKLIANPTEAAPKTTTLKSFDFAYSRRTEVELRGSRLSLEA